MTPSERSSLLAYGSECKPPPIAGSASSHSSVKLVIVSCIFASVALVINAFKNIAFQGTLVHRTPMMGKSKASKDVKIEENSCESDTKYSKHTVKTAYELPFAALFKDNKGQKKFEASSVTIVDDNVYAVCDSSYAISKFDDRLLPFSENNKQIGSPDRDGDVESGYEAIFHHEGLFYVVRESILHHYHDNGDEAIGMEDEDSVKVGKKHAFHAIIEELVLGEDDYTIQSECMCEYEFEGASKGFEGAVGFPDATGELYILGLCEGNHCSEKNKADVGNGRVVMMKKKLIPDSNNPGDLSCVWETIRTVHIPKSVEFIDYSAIDITADGQVAITSQENSSLWIGSAVGITDGVIDPEKFGFLDDGNTYQFPKSSDCHTVYCNVEGIHWMNDQMLMGVSDKMKGKGKQDYRCFEKDQSIHAFVLP